MTISTKAKCILLACLTAILANGNAQDINASLDSLKSRISFAIPDTLSKGVIDRMDSTKQKIQSELDSVHQSFRKAIDEFKNNNLSTSAYTHKLDSTYGSFNERLQKMKEKYSSSKIKPDKSFLKLDSIISSKSHVLDSLLHSNGLNGIGDVKLPNSFDPSIPDIPELNGVNLPSSSLPKVNTNLNMPDVSKSLNKSVPGLDLPKLPQTGISTKLDGVKEITDQAGEYASNIKDVTSEAEKIKGGEYSEKLDTEAQNQILKIDEIKGISDQTKAADAMKGQFKELTKSVKDPEQLKEKVKEEFVDHFAGKEEMVKKDMDDIAKIQMKYRDVADSRFLPKRPPNEMKSKPFVERLITGFTFQVFHQDNVSVDVSPFIGYRFSGRITAGISGYRRLTYFEKDDKLRAVDYYGFRTFGSFKVIKSVMVYTELERFRNYVEQGRVNFPSIQPDPGWHWKWNLGAQQRYSIGKGFYGNFIIMYDLMQIKKFPNSSGSAIRFGFDYQIKKKQKK